MGGKHGIVLTTFVLDPKLQCRPREKKRESSPSITRQFTDLRSTSTKTKTTSRWSMMV